MKISYTFATGEKTEVEVNESIGTLILDSRRIEDNADRKERYHCYSSDAVDFEGDEFADPDTPESILFGNYENEKLCQALDRLSDIQRKRLILLAEGLSMREIARREGVAYICVRDSIEQARKKIKKFL